MKRKILVVDDEILILKSINTELKRSGYNVDTVENGEDALAMLKKHKYDLLITDLMLEGIGGLELLAETRKKLPTMPVIIITGYGELDSAIEALRLGAADYLLKPCSNEELILRVDNCIEKLELQERIKLYEDILPICSSRKKIRDDSGKKPGTGDWMDLGQYLHNKAGIHLSDGMCPDCAEEMYGKEEWFKNKR
jgi:DNA-binding NtrC family response regulator